MPDRAEIRDTIRAAPFIPEAVTVTGLLHRTGLTEQDCRAVSNTAAELISRLRREPARLRSPRPSSTAPTWAKRFASSPADAWTPKNYAPSFRELFRMSDQAVDPNRKRVRFTPREPSKTSLRRHPFPRGYHANLRVLPPPNLAPRSIPHYGGWVTVARCFRRP